MNAQTEPKVEVLVETENYSIWKAEEPDGEITYHLEMNNVTIHMFQEEYDEFVALVNQLLARK
jgi:hypothetical protein